MKVNIVANPSDIVCTINNTMSSFSVGKTIPPVNGSTSPVKKIHSFNYKHIEQIIF